MFQRSLYPELRIFGTCGDVALTLSKLNCRRSLSIVAIALRTVSNYNLLGNNISQPLSDQNSENVSNSNNSGGGGGGAEGNESVSPLQSDNGVKSKDTSKDMSRDNESKGLSSSDGFNGRISISGLVSLKSSSSFASSSKLSTLATATAAQPNILAQDSLDEKADDEDDDSFHSVEDEPISMQELIAEYSNNISQLKVNNRFVFSFKFTLFEVFIVRLSTLILCLFCF
jgi:hypothetical protein